MLGDLVPNPDPTQGTRLPLPGSLGPEPQSLGPLPAFGGNTPSTPGPMPTLKPMVTNPQDQLRQQLQEKISQYYTPSQPTGFWGKLGHALAQTGVWQNSGTMEARRNQEAGREKEVGEIQGQDIAQQKQTSEAGLQSAQADYYKQHGQSLQQHQVTPEEATAMGNPDLAGSLMDPKAWEALIKQQGVNATKVSTTAANNQTKLTTANLEAMNKIQPHITVDQGGEPHVMERDPATGQYSIDRGIAPPNYASVLPEILQTKTTELLGPDNVMHRYQYDPQTKTYSEDMGAAPTGTAAHQIFQAAAIENLAPKVIEDINANRDVVGNLESYYKGWLNGTPVADPHASQMMAELMSLASTQPALHAFRSSNAMEAYEKILGGLAKNPDATIAAINGLTKTAESFTSLPNSNKPAAKPAGTAQDLVYDDKGVAHRYKGTGSRSDPKNYEAVTK
jgi:hypothetical protein